MDDILKQYQAMIDDTDKLEKFKKDKTSKSKDIDKILNDINKQVIKKENQKRRFKTFTLGLVSILTVIQMIFFNLIVGYVIASISLDINWFKSLEISFVSEMLSFLKYYIGATVVELLGMLFFIIRYVFSISKDKK